MDKKKAIVLLSGGLDSATCLAVANDKGYECYALSFDYGQRHSVELEASKEIAKKLGVKAHNVISFDLSLWGGSALTDDIDVPNHGETEGIPITYVPARNMVFLSFAVAWSEVIGAKDIFIGVNSVDYSGYPDCRPQFIEEFEKCAVLGTKACDEGWKFEVHAPLQNLNKAEIIRLGVSLGIDYSLTHSCYNPTEQGFACGICDSCVLRKNGFLDADIQDPTKYL
jgi:7-cyano-7-deazaguanine synthase